MLACSSCCRGGLRAGDLAARPRRGYGRHLNVNGDDAAAAIAIAIGAEELVLVADVPGVMADGVVIRSSTSNRQRRWSTTERRAAEWPPSCRPRGARWNSAWRAYG